VEREVSRRATGRASRSRRAGSSTCRRSGRSRARRLRSRCASSQRCSTPTSARVRPPLSSPLGLDGRLTLSPSSSPARSARLDRVLGRRLCDRHRHPLLLGPARCVSSPAGLPPRRPPSSSSRLTLARPPDRRHRARRLVHLHDRRAPLDPVHGGHVHLARAHDPVRPLFPLPLLLPPADLLRWCAQQPPSGQLPRLLRPDGPVRLHPARRRRQLCAADQAGALSGRGRGGRGGGAFCHRCCAFVTPCNLRVSTLLERVESWPVEESVRAVERRPPPRFAFGAASCGHHLASRARTAPASSQTSH